MGDITQLIKIAVSLKIQPNNGPVFFKVDGQRFGQNRTIKLLTGSVAGWRVDRGPETDCSFYVSCRSMGIGGVNFPLEQTSKDPQVVTYTGIYDAEGMTHTKSGDRQPVQVNIQFNEVGNFESV
ncbi:CB1 cannabinoid receptor-interacting protein 1-like [Polyodon spathula]|uniref:CB1 cannabinoid receptor-interacting protein 1-like n=1 Tax=Polyodon spathula TaxID=7913 RepID=UPI001B7F2387|nr:CB1 cannabinoid receptor-interacting protein 1-like [Polyodon spathula]